MNAPPQNSPALAGAELTAPLTRRLDSVDEELFLAWQVVGELVRRLEPVLPLAFGQEAAAELEAPPLPPGPSPLAERLAVLARRTHSVVRELQTIAAAVDL